MYNFTIYDVIVMVCSVSTLVVYRVIIVFQLFILIFFSSFTVVAESSYMYNYYKFLVFYS